MLGEIELANCERIRGLFESAGQTSNWAGGLPQHAAEGQRVAGDSSFLDVSCDELEGLICETL